MGIKLSAKDYTKLLDVLENPPPVSEALKKLYKDTNESVLQDMFNLLIREGLYADLPNEIKYSTRFMCEAAELGLEEGLLTHDCVKTLTEAISNYLGDFGSLYLLLKHNDLPSEFEDRKAIYLDWTNRPNLQNK